MTHFADRSSHEVFSACPRKSYWGKYHDGVGLVPAGAKFELEFGKAIHSHLEGLPPDFSSLYESLKQGDGLPKVTPDGLPIFEEAVALWNGLTQTYSRFILPRLLEEYDIVGNEVEMTMDLGDGIVWQSRLDMILRRRADGLYFVGEAKTTSYPDSLMKQSRTNFQLLMECEALRRWLNDLPVDSVYRERLDGSFDLEPQVGGALLLVFNKGQRKRASEKEQAAGKDGFRQLSPFTYWYGHELTDGDWEYQLDYTSRKGWSRVPTWTIPNWYEVALANWPDVVKSQVQLWPSVDFDSVRVESVLRQVVRRERRLAKFSRFAWEHGYGARPDMVDDCFPQNFANCQNDSGYGKQCPMFDLCFSPNVARDPLASGLYEARVPNHRREREALTK